MRLSNSRHLFRFAILPLFLFKLGAAAQCTLALNPAAPSTSGGATVYTYVLSGAGCAGTAAAAGPPAVPPAPGVQSLLLNVNPAFLPVTPSPGTNFSQQIIPGQGVLITFSAPAAASYTFTIAAQSNLTSSTPSTSSYTVQVGSPAVSTTGPIMVPGFQTPDQITGLSPVASDESTVDVLLGVGAHVAFANYPDYNLSTNSVLVSTGVGHAIPEVLIGAGFTTGKYLLNSSGCKVGKPCLRKFGKQLLPDSIFVNTQVPVGNTSASGSIDGFTFGAGYKLQKFLEVMVGFSLAQYNEPSTGFRNAASSVVTANAALPANQQVPLYLRYSASDILLNKPNSLDGFPILQQTLNGSPGGQIYSGSALLNHYRGGLFIGLAYPFSLNKLFQTK